MRPDSQGGVAIVGVACTYPGARTAAQFWNNITGKVDAIADVKPERWDPRDFYDPDPAKEDKLYCKRGGYLPVTYAFNPRRYGIMPSSIEGTEVDHLLVLRAAQEALEDAGYGEGRRPLDGRSVGIVLGKGNYTGPGVTTLLYRSVVTQQILAILKGLHPELSEADLEKLKAAVRDTMPKLTPEGAAGLIPNICTGRVANRLDLMGPNFTVDAACASSLIATELAIRDLRAGNADMILAGGVHVFAHIPFLQVFDTMRAMSLSSTIRPFDQDCDGTISGEGVGVLALKRLADAERDGDRIYAVIKGVGSASDGRAKGIVAPRPEGEELAMQRAYAAAGVAPQTVELIEAHGTGTPTGDAAEVDAMRRVFGDVEGGRKTIAVGSVKSMIGHAMPASGAASLIKTALALHHRILPPTLNCRRPRRELAEPGSPFYVSAETRPWIRAAGSTPRRAGVSAFGFGGINAHVVMEEYTGAGSTQTMLRDWDCEFIVLEGNTREEIAEAAGKLKAYARAQPPGVTLRDVAFTVNTNLAGLPERLTIVATTLADLAAKLDHAAGRLGEAGPIKDRQGVYSFTGSEIANGKLALLFPGEGAQYVNMLSDLCLHFPAVREAFDLADAGTKDPRRRPASQAIFPAPSFTEAEAEESDKNLWSIDRATEAVLTADAAVFRLLEALNLQTDMMAGHSAGEWIGLAASGVLDTNEFFHSMERLAQMYERVTTDSEVPQMSMIAVAAGRERVEKITANLGCEIHFANDNCSRQVVIVVTPGDEEPVMDRLRAGGVFVEKLPYDRGYHTPAFTYICEPLRQFFSAMKMNSPGVPLYSCSTAAEYPADAGGILDLVTNTFARPLYFRQTIENMYEAGARIFVESGPRGNLTAFVSDILRGRPHLAVSVDQFRRPGITTLMHTVAMLAAARVPLNFAPLYERRSPRRLTLDPAVDRFPDPDEAPGTMQVPLSYPRFGVPPPMPVPEPLIVPIPATGAFPPSDWETMPGGGGVSSDAGTALEEHALIMQEMMRTHEAVMRTALGYSGAGAQVAAAPAPAPPAVDAPDAGPAPRPMLKTSSVVSHEPGQEITLRVVLDVNEHLFLDDHCLYFAASEFGNQGEPVLSMPMTGTLELMAESASLLCPRLRVVGAERLQALKWINLNRGEERTVLTVSASRKQERAIQVAVRPEGKATELLAEAVILFGDRLDGPPEPEPLELRQPRPPRFRGQAVYGEHLMFHGPRFQGILSIDKVGENGVCGRLRTLANDKVLASDARPRFAIDPFLLDAAGQMLGYWPTEYLDEGYVALPIRIGRIKLYQEAPLANTPLECRVHIREVSRRQVRGDYEVLAPDGRVWIRVEGWEDWRFYWERHIHEFWRFPGRALNGRSISHPVLDRCGVVCQRIDRMSEVDKTGLWELLWMRMILNRSELAAYNAMSAAAAERVEWIFHTACAKDAARSWVKRQTGRDTYPADIEVRHGRSNGLAVTAVHAEMPFVAASFDGAAGVGVAGSRPLGVYAQVRRPGVSIVDLAQRAALGLSSQAAHSKLSAADETNGLVILSVAGETKPVEVHILQEGDLAIALAVWGNGE